MKLNETKVKCPRCRSNQKFSLQRKYLLNSEKFTVYVQCKKCRKEIDLYESSEEIENLRKVLRKAKKAHKISPTHSSLNLLANIKKRLYNLERSLSEE
jgi:transcription initiation factor IIE alpha subunit